MCKHNVSGTTKAFLEFGGDHTCTMEQQSSSFFGRLAKSGKHYIHLTVRSSKGQCKSITRTTASIPWLLDSR